MTLMNSTYEVLLNTPSHKSSSSLLRVFYTMECIAHEICRLVTLVDATRVNRMIS